MKIRKILPYLLIVVIIALGLAGCKAGAQDIEEAREGLEVAKDEIKEIFGDSTDIIKDIKNLIKNARI